MASASKTVDFAATPIQACRVPLFAPTRRPELRTWSVENAWGRVEITGRLGQQHRDLLDALRMVAEDEYWEADGSGEHCLHLMVDPARIRAMLGWDCISHRQIDSLLDDLVQTLVKAFEAKGETYPARSNIVALVAPAREGGRPDGAVLYPERSGGIGAKPKPYLKVSFGAIWSRLLREDLLTRYNLRALVKLPSRPGQTAPGDRIGCIHLERPATGAAGSPYQSEQATDTGLPDPRP